MIIQKRNFDIILIDKNNFSFKFVINIWTIKIIFSYCLVIYYGMKENLNRIKNSLKLQKNFDFYLCMQKECFFII